MTKHIDLRLPDTLAGHVDQRAKTVGLSRNEWITRALRWATEQPVRETVTKEKL